MLCHINRDNHSIYSDDFPTQLDLTTEIDPYHNTSLQSLCERAFKVGMPYFSFAVGQLNGTHKVFYKYYDAVSHRLYKHNHFSSSAYDPTTRLPIQRIDYFAIANSENFEANQVVQAYPYPLQFDLPISSQDLERYSFSSLNFFVIECEDKTEIETLKKIHEVIQLALELKSRETWLNPDTKQNLLLEKQKWRAIRYF